MSHLNLKTGDLLLFDYNETGLLGFLNKAIKYFTNSPYSHIAMVLKDPSFIHPTLKGYYIWESSWEGTPDPQDGKIKLGVQITPLDEVFNSCKKTNSSIFLRRVNCPEVTFNKDILSQTHEVVYDKPYDIIPTDWIEALFRKDDHPQKTNRFWCSALIGYIYSKCGIIDPTTDWSILRPSDFSTDVGTLTCINGASLSEQEERIL